MRHRLFRGSTRTPRVLALGALALAAIAVVVAVIVVAGGPTPSARRASGHTTTTVARTTSPRSTGTGAPTVASGVIAQDDFARMVDRGWGTAATGGPWALAKGEASNLSVNGGTGVIAVTAGSYLTADQVVILPEAPAKDLVGSFDVTFMENINRVNPQNGGVVAYIVARFHDTSPTGYYRSGLVWEASTRRLWLRTQTPAGKGRPGDFTIERNTGIDPTADYPSGPPYGPYHVKVEISGSDPTRFSSKVWRAGSPEPAAWMLSGTDAADLGPQGAGAVGVRASNDLQGSPNAFVDLTAHVAFGRLLVAPTPG